MEIRKVLSKPSPLEPFVDLLFFFFKFRYCMMRSHIISVVVLLSLLHYAISVPYISRPTHGRSDQLYRTKTVYEWPDGTWVENLAIMRDGSILATLLNVPQLWHVNPFTGEATLVKEIGGYAGLLGITETRPGQFAFIAGNFSLQTVSSTSGSYAIWNVDTHKSPFAVSKIADIPEAAFLNGMDYLGPEQHAVLIAESEQGLIYRFDLSSGRSSIAIDSPYLKKCKPTYPEGINGLKIHQGYAYYTNAYCGFFARFPIDATGNAVGPSETLAYTEKPGTWIYDDLVVTQQGVAYLAGGTENVIVEAAPPSLLPGGLGEAKISAMAPRPGRGGMSQVI